MDEHDCWSPVALIDQLVEMGALPDVRQVTGQRDHGAIVEKVLEGLRPPGLRFAWAVEERLRTNDHKGGWRDEMPQWFIEVLIEEVHELDADDAVWSRGMADGLAE